MLMLLLFFDANVIEFPIHSLFYFFPFFVSNEFISDVINCCELKNYIAKKTKNVNVVNSHEKALKEEQKKRVK